MCWETHVRFLYCGCEQVEHIQFCDWAATPWIVNSAHPKGLPMQPTIEISPINGVCGFCAVQEVEKVEKGKAAEVGIGIFERPGGLGDIHRGLEGGSRAGLSGFGGRVGGMSPRVVDFGLGGNGGSYEVKKKARSLFRVLKRGSRPVSASYDTDDEDVGLVGNNAGGDEKKKMLGVGLFGRKKLRGKGEEGKGKGREGENEKDGKKKGGKANDGGKKEGESQDYQDVDAEGEDIAEEEWRSMFGEGLAPAGYQGFSG